MKITVEQVEWSSVCRLKTSGERSGERSSVPHLMSRVASYSRGVTDILFSRISSAGVVFTIHGYPADNDFFFGYPQTPYWSRTLLFWSANTFVFANTFFLFENSCSRTDCVREPVINFICMYFTQTFGSRTFFWSANIPNLNRTLPNVEILTEHVR